MDHAPNILTDATSVDALLDGCDAVPQSLSSLLPRSIRASSQHLGWWPLNVERREAVPDRLVLPGGTSEHCIFVTLSEAHYVREDDAGFSDHSLEIGHVTIHPARRPVCWEWDTPIHSVNLTLDPIFLDEMARDLFGLDAARMELMLVDRERDLVISNIATSMVRELMQPDIGSALMARALAHQLSVHLIRHYVRCPQPRELPGIGLLPRAVSAAVEFIEGAYARDIALADVAQAAHVSPFHLSRQFKKTMGMTPHHFLIRTRVESARALLAAGSRSLAEVAAAVGFADQSHLTRHFKRLLGVTPGQIQAQ